MTLLQEFIRLDLFFIFWELAFLRVTRTIWVLSPMNVLKIWNLKLSSSTEATYYWKLCIVIHGKSFNIMPNWYRYRRMNTLAVSLSLIAKTLYRNFFVMITMCVGIFCAESPIRGIMKIPFQDFYVVVRKITATIWIFFFFMIKSLSAATQYFFSNFCIISKQYAFLDALIL